MGSYRQLISGTHSWICRTGEGHKMLSRPYHCTSQRRIPWLHTRSRLRGNGPHRIYFTRAFEEEAEEGAEEGGEEEAEEEAEDDEDEEEEPFDYRPWTFNLPSIEEMAEKDWPDKVADWRMFWVMFDQWLYVQRQLARKKYKKLSTSYLTWLNLDYETPEQLEQYLTQVQL